MHMRVLLALAFFALSPASQAQERSGERSMMMATCGRVGSEGALCRSVVNDARVSMNTKRSCLEAITLILQGTGWSKVRSLPPTLTCESGLGRAGYPVAELLARWNRLSARR